MKAIAEAVGDLRQEFMQEILDELADGEKVYLVNCTSEDLVLNYLTVDCKLKIKTSRYGGALGIEIAS